MGIKDLNSILTYTYILKSKFANETVGLDFLNFWYISHSKACKEIVQELPLGILSELVGTERMARMILKRSMHYFLESLFSLVKFQIKPLVIFEESCFALKNQYARVRRDSERQKSKDRLSTLEINTKNEKTYRMLLVRTLGFDKALVMVEVKTTLDRLGLPWLQCITEGEHLGAALCREGYIVAFYSTDTDVIPLGCPFIIAKQGTEEEPEAPYFKTIQTRHALREHGLTLDQFREVCILSSCDFNERVKIRDKRTGKEKPLGIKTALKLIKEYGSFEAIKVDQEFIGEEKLEFEACKRIFTVQSVEALCPDFDPTKLKLRIPRDNELEENKESMNEDERYIFIFLQTIEERNVRYILPPTVIFA